MVKCIIVEDNVTTHLQSFVKNKQVGVGLIIGKVSKEKDYALKLIQSPQPTEGERFHVDASWVAGHAEEVSHMLPGGIFITGVFAVTEGEVVADLRKCLFAIRKKLAASSVAKFVEAVELEGSTHGTVLHVDSLSGRVTTCKQFDVTDNASGARPVEWKTQMSSAHSWRMLTASVDFDFTAYCDETTNPTAFIRKSVGLQCERLNAAVVDINRQVRHSQELLDPDSGAKSRRFKHQQQPHRQQEKPFACRFFLRKQENEEEEHDEVKMRKCEQSVRINGSTTACAYVLSKSTVKSAIDALKADAIQCLNHRCNLLLEDLRERKLQFAPGTVVSLPKRVSFKDVSCTNPNFKWFEYMFPWESVSECQDRIKENVSMDVELDDHSEQFSDMVTRAHSLKPAADSVASHNVTPMKKSTRFKLLGATLSVGAGLIAMALSYLSLAE